MYPTKFNTSKSGLTLIEVLISLAVFAVLMTAASASILGSIDANQKAQSINSVMSNLTVAMESISRDIRVGSNYSFSETGTPLDTESWELADLDAPGFFYRDDHNVKKRIYVIDADDQGMLMIEDVDSDQPGVPLTAMEVDITSLRITIFLQDETGRRLQPSVKISLEGNVTVQERTATNFYLQTLVSQRLFNDEL